MGLETVKPPEGRDERVLIHGREARLMVIKNRTSLHESLRTCMLDNKREHYLFLLDNAVHEGSKKPWIEDTDLEGILDRAKSFHLAGSGGAHLSLMNEQMAVKTVQEISDKIGFDAETAGQEEMNLL